MVGHDVPLELREGEKLLVAAATLHQVALLVELPPVVGSVLYQLILSLTTTPRRLALVQSNLDFLPMYINQVHLHVSKGGSDRLAAAAFNLQLHRVFTILLVRCLWGVGPLNRHVILMMANGRLHGQHHLVYLSQMTEVHPHISKGLLTELAAQRPTWAYLRVVKLHMGAKAARVSVRFAAD